MKVKIKALRDDGRVVSVALFVDRGEAIVWLEENREEYLKFGFSKLWVEDC